MSDILPTYRQFYKAHKTERVLFFQGGKRSGKTFFICQLIAIKAMSGKFRIFCITADYPRSIDLRATFQQATGYTARGSADGLYIKIGQSTIYFRSFDDPAKAEQGKECDYAYFYECRSIPIGVVRGIMAGVKIQAWADYNPCEVFWKQEYYPDAPTLITTYRDNPYLPDVLVQEYREAEERAKLPTATDYDRWWADVFCYGKENVKARLCFEKAELCKREEFERCVAREVLAVDFGGEQGDRDPTVLIGVKFIADYIYIREYYYSNEQGDDGLSDALRRAYEGNRHIMALVYETATNGKRRIVETMRQAGVMRYTYPAIKGAGSVAGGINDLQAYKLLITEESGNVWHERCNYRFELVNGVLRPMDKFNHAFDALRYAYRFWQVQGRNM